MIGDMLYFKEVVNVDRVVVLWLTPLSCVLSTIAFSEVLCLFLCVYELIKYHVIEGVYFVNYNNNSSTNNIHTKPP